jgi:hypothetical protein
MAGSECHSGQEAKKETERGRGRKRGDTKFPLSVAYFLQQLGFPKQHHHPGTKPPTQNPLCRTLPIQTVKHHLLHAALPDCITAPSAPTVMVFDSLGAHCVRG